MGDHLAPAARPVDEQSRIRRITMLHGSVGGLYRLRSGIKSIPLIGFFQSLAFSPLLPRGWWTVQPTLDEMRSWAATVDVPAAARALGISKSHLYELIKRGQVPFRVVAFGNRYRVITSSLVAYLEAC